MFREEKKEHGEDVGNDEFVNIGVERPVVVAINPALLERLSKMADEVHLIRNDLTELQETVHLRFQAEEKAREERVAVPAVEPAQVNAAPSIQEIYQMCDRMGI